MADKVTVSQRFGAWFRAVLARRDVYLNDALHEALSDEREAWLDLQGSILGHDVSRCACIGCNVTRHGEFNAHQAAAVSLERHDSLQRRSV